jgi:hypothetical protein
MKRSFSLLLVPLLATACSSLVGVPYASSLEDGGSAGADAARDSASALDQTSPPPPADASAGADATAPQDVGTPADIGVPIDTAPPPPMGCAPGATVIPLTVLGSAVVFGTTGAVCVTYMGSVTGWNASNVEGRSVTVMGSTTQTLAMIPGENQPGLMPGADGYIYWNFTSGTASYASMSAF